MKKELHVIPEYLKSHEPDPVKAFESIISKIPNPVPFDKMSGKKDLTLGGCPLNEERFVSFNNMPNKCGKYKDETTFSFAKSKKPESWFWPTAKSMDPFYKGTGHEKFYDTEKHENTKPSLHTGYVKMAVVAGRDDLKVRENRL